MISRTLEYALRAVVWLAARPLSPVTTKQLAEGTQVPTSYLSKVMQTLVDAEIVGSQRGLGGGFMLAREASKINVLDIVNAVDPIRRFRTCPLKLPAHGLRLCPLHQRLDDALAMIEKAFGSTPISDLVADQRNERALCPSAAPPSKRRGGEELPVLAGKAPRRARDERGRKRG